MAKAFDPAPAERAIEAALPQVKAAFEAEGIDAKGVVVSVVYESAGCDWATSSAPPECSSDLRQMLANSLRIAADETDPDV